MLSSSSHSHRILQNIEPVRNLFAALFLSSIGEADPWPFPLDPKALLLSASAYVVLV